MLIRCRRACRSDVLRVHNSAIHTIPSPTSTTIPPQNISLEMEHLFPLQATCAVGSVGGGGLPCGLGLGGGGGGGAGFALHQASLPEWSLHHDCACWFSVAMLPPQSYGNEQTATQSVGCCIGRK